MIELKNIDFFYHEENYIFKDFSLTLFDNKKYWLQGKNGSGKTTLLNIILGINKVNEGNCYLNYNKSKTLFVPSTPFYEPYMLLEDFLLFYLNKMLKIPNQFINLDELIKLLGLESNRHTSCKDLSKGTKQKIIISALFTDYPWEYLFVDEPFEHLDMATCELVKERIFNGETFVFIINHKEQLLSNIYDIKRLVL
ncbi:ATP-binding cassette domain-containing protein [Gottfriedia sp. S16(2024)]|uniref:ATP-binding cassette domain-containing protein n=1 Tax=Gottfriedia sp. S16(2024) TaxID=3162883 RepID=UPI003D1C4FD4